MKKHLPLILKLLISFALIAFLLSKIDLSETWATIRNLKLVYFIPALALCLFSMFLNTTRWLFLLRRLKLNVPLWELFRLNMASVFHGMLLPGGQLMGEVIKCIRIARTNEEKKEVVTSVFMDKVLGLFALACLGLVTIVGSSSPIMHREKFMLLFLIPFLVGALVLLSLWRGWIKAIIRTLAKLRWLPQVVKQRVFSPLHDMMTYYHDAGTTILSGIIMSLAFQLVMAGAYSLCALSLGLKIHYVDIIWIFGGVSMLIFVPISILGIGLREGGCIVLAGLIGISRPDALALSFLIFIATLFNALVGALLDTRSRSLNETA